MADAGAPPAKRLPFGASGAVLGLLAALPVWSFHDLEASAAAVGVDGGPMALVFVAAIFAAVWVPGVFGLAAFSPRPAREGSLAGALVAVAVAVEVLPLALGFGWFVLVLVPLFGALAVGAGALTGAAALRLQQGRSSRAAAVAAILAGAVFLACSLLFMPAADLLASPVGWAVLALAAALIGGGALALRDPGRPPAA